PKTNGIHKKTKNRPTIKKNPHQKPTKKFNPKNKTQPAEKTQKKKPNPKHPPRAPKKKHNGLGGGGHFVSPTNPVWLGAKKNHFNK
ncbi:hypothetical protein Q8G46_28045, partial [Klebsiella pneumoniae]|uniref:hypothetical protein n=1 Tax=Klebsiella pneumoniae TaxID=573 RepID=UPI003013664B